MHLITLVFLLLTTLCSQEIFTVVTVKETNPYAAFETEIINAVIELYKRNENPDVQLEKQFVSSFKDVFTVLDSTTQRDSFFGIYLITITEDRLQTYDFSHPYLPTYNIFTTLNPNVTHSPFEQNRRHYTIGVVSNTLQEVSLRQMNLENTSVVGFQLYDDMERALRKNEIDIMFAENIALWNNKKLRVLWSDQTTTERGFGIMYPKHSKLKDKLDKYLKYFIKSMRFKQLTKNILGKDAVDYFIQNVK